ncbi:Aldo/keto reductase family protein [Olavius algarvensis associated proteobacterium Delta 3]|nr:Aldo/keto reductase family protein [Olavius algarvensis associated proteobacterium Delta 3]
MLKGHATPDGTGRYADQHEPVQYVSLGRTDCMTSQAGFGGYRISTGVPHHENALRTAITSGINIIDTSANYADGGSESLAGQVLEDLTTGGVVKREQIIVISKVGYLQGQNFELSQERKSEGRPFQELVEYGKGLEHCIHPEFIEDQLTRSLDRLRLETLDGYLLHNPEYYLGWAKKNGMALEDAREEYYRRIRNAFQHLEKEVKNGRIRWYGVSSNTFPSPSNDPEFTWLETAWQIAEAIAIDHHFAIAQMPFNLMESGAALEVNQSGGKSVLSFAADKNLGVLINRPLNAIVAGRLLCLADMAQTERMDTNDVIETIRQLEKSETRLWRKILTPLDIPDGLKVRIKQQNEVGGYLKHYWKNFGSYENFRQAWKSMFVPRVQGVFDFLKPHAEANENLAGWLTTHQEVMDEAFEAVGSIYAEATARQLNEIRYAVNSADPDWEKEGTLSQKAIRALRSTAGVSTVLVGMRRESYVEDVLAELRRPIKQEDRRESWKKLSREFTQPS